MVGSTITGRIRGTLERLLFRNVPSPPGYGRCAESRYSTKTPQVRRWSLAIGLVLVLGAPAAQARDYDFKVIAGGYTGDGMQATSAVLQTPGDIAYDSAGNLYISDMRENRIRRVSTSGVISTLAGNGEFGFSGDGGPANLATLRNPMGLVFDAVGNLYFSDSGNHRIRRISPDGDISTVIGDGVARLAGDGGLAAVASVNTPYDIVFGPNGNLYISDVDPTTYIGSVREVDSAGVITTILSMTIGNYSQDSLPLYLPHGMAFDSQGNLLVADFGNKTILKMTPAGAVTTVMNRYGAGNSEPAPQVPTILFGPNGILADSSGNIFVTDSCNLLELTVAGIVKHVAGGYDCKFSGDGGDASIAEIWGADGLVIGPDGALVFADTSNGRVRRIAAGVINTIAGKGSFSGDGGPAIAASFSGVFGLTVDQAGTIYLVDRTNGRVRRVKTNGIIDTIGGGGSSEDDGVPATSASLLLPWGIAINDSGMIYVTDRYGSVRTISKTGVIGTLINYYQPYGLNLDAAGNIYAASASGRRVYRMHPHDRFEGRGRVVVRRTVVRAPIAGSGFYGRPIEGGVAVDQPLGDPWDVAADAHGNIFIATSTRVYKVDESGLIWTVAGSDNEDSGDGGPATLASLSSIFGLAVAPNGTLYLASGSLRVIAPDGIITTAQNLPHDVIDVALDDAGAIYVSTRSGRILKAAPAPLPLAANDFNGDGISDILWRNIQTGDNVIWNSATSSSQQPMVGVTNLDWKIVGSGDFDGDGVTDVLWRNASSGSNVVWKRGNAADPLPVRGLTDSGWKVASVADFDGDGHADILWHNAKTGVNTIWRSAYYRNFQSIRTVTNLDWDIVGAGDFDGDGVADVLWRNQSTGENTIWLSADASRQQAVTNMTDTDWHVAGVADFNGDGRDDMFWSNARTGQNVIWLSGNSSTQQSVEAAQSLDWKVADTADFNGDGNADVLWHNNGTGASVVWQSANASSPQPVTTVLDVNWRIMNSQSHESTLKSRTGVGRGRIFRAPVAR